MRQIQKIGIKRMVKFGARKGVLQNYDVKYGTFTIPEIIHK